LLVSVRFPTKLVLPLAVPVEPPVSRTMLTTSATRMPTVTMALSSMCSLISVCSPSGLVRVPDADMENPLLCTAELAVLRQPRAPPVG